jgi:hypothetical protein
MPKKVASFSYDENSSLLILSLKKEASWAKSAHSTPRSQPKAPKKLRRLLLSSELVIMKGCQRVTSKGQ